MNLSTIRITFLLCRLKLRLQVNSMKNLASVGKAFGIAVAIVFIAIIMASGASDLIQNIKMLPYAELMLDWLLGALLLYSMFIVFTGDLITGHSLNSGQMSSDFAYLRSLPVPPLSLILVKLFERVITDYLGLIILFSAFLGIVSRNGFNLEGLIIALFLYLQLSFVIGLLINLCTICLSRFFRPTTINNFFSLLGYVSAFLTIAPYLVLSNFPLQIMQLIIDNLDLLNDTLFRFMVPAQWLAVSLLSASFCDEFFYFSAFWAVCMLSGSLLFHAAIKLNWYSFSHATPRTKMPEETARFRGMIHKETLLIRKDFNLLINALLMPITLIVLEIYFLKEVFSFSDPATVLNTVCGSVIYFCMFGPVNCIGYEGKAISLLETLPISPRNLLLKKLTFWGIIAELIFMPAAALVLYQMKFDLQTVILGTGTTGLFTIACVAAAVSISAIFPNFDSKILQQRSTLTGKFAALGMMLLLIPAKNLTPASVFSLTVFAVINLLVWIKAETNLYFRLDDQARRTGNNIILDTLLLFCSFAACEITVSHFFKAVAPGVDTGMWNWFLTAVIFLPIVFIKLFFAAGNSQAGTDRPQAPVRQPRKAAVIFAGTLILLIMSVKVHDFRAEATALFRGDVYQIAQLSEIFAINAFLWKFLLTLAAAALGGGFSHHLYRTFSPPKMPKTMGTLTTTSLLMLVSPAPLIPSALLAGLATAAFNFIPGAGGIAALSGAIFAAAQAIFFIFL